MGDYLVVFGICSSGIDKEVLICLLFSFDFFAPYLCYASTK